MSSRRRPRSTRRRADAASFHDFNIAPPRAQIPRITKNQYIPCACAHNTWRPIFAPLTDNRRQLYRNEDIESRYRKSAQSDKWSFCLTVGTLWPANQERP
jgi:hypothetical protein